MPEKELKTLEEFLLNSPPGSQENIKISAYETISGTRRIPAINLSAIKLYCENEDCKKIMNFTPNSSTIYPDKKATNNLFLTFHCKHCTRSFKTYAVSLWFKDNSTALVLKLGESPPFGEPTPTKLLRILGDEKDYYLKGRRAESQNMGIAAFAYYRRIVENMKDTLFDEIIDVAKIIEAGEDKIRELEVAKSSFQFTNAFKDVYIPESLLLDGHNPLLVLHDALSKGLHAKTDEECLEVAQNIRIVLSDFAVRLADMKKDRSKLKEAINKLMSNSK